MMHVRTSWLFPPEEIAGAGRHSLWRGFKLALDALQLAIGGSILQALLEADARIHRLIADSKRRRKRQFSPAPGLS